MGWRYSTEEPATYWFGHGSKEELCSLALLYYDVRCRADDDDEIYYDLKGTSATW